MTLRGSDDAHAGGGTDTTPARQGLATGEAVEAVESDANRDVPQPRSHQTAEGEAGGSLPPAMANTGVPTELDVPRGGEMTIHDFQQMSAAFRAEDEAATGGGSVPIPGLHFPSRDPSVCGPDVDPNDRDPYRPSPVSKYNRYHVPVSREEGDRATEIRIFSWKRPHMRAFHCAWISFFWAFVLWFASAPLTPEIQKSLNLTKQQIWTSSITNDCAAIVLRIIVGPICDSYGARLPMAAVLLVSAIPTGMIGLINSAAGLAITRLMIGIAGSSFVMAQTWPSRMFARELSGTANGLVGGWGNLGGAVAQVVMGTLLFPAFTDYFDGDAERSWRFICVIPAVIAFVWGCIMPFISDDAPLGNYSELRKKGSMDRVFFTTSLRSGVQRNTYILFIQYACSFGVELVMNHAAVLYFTSEFGLETSEAAALGFVYGSMNIFARGLGGFFSDRLYANFGMRGRLWLTTVLLFLMGATIFIFSYVQSLVTAVLIMCVFSIFTQATEGAIYGIVPYVSKLYTGSVSGFVGSGGNVGSVLFGFCFRQLDYNNAFALMGGVVFASSLTSLFIHFPRHAGLVTGKDHPSVLHPKRKERQQAYLDEQAAGRVPSAHITSANSDENADEDDNLNRNDGVRAASDNDRADDKSVSGYVTA